MNNDNRILEFINKNKELAEKCRQAKTAEERAEIMKGVPSPPAGGYPVELGEEDLDMVAGGTVQQGLWVCECLICGWRSGAVELSQAVDLCYAHEHKSAVIILPAES